MNHQLETAWHGGDLIVLQGGREIDRLSTHDIERVLLVCKGSAGTPGDLVFAVIETATEHVILPAESGIAGRVHFERQSLWTDKACIYWVHENAAALPRRLRPGLWLLRRRQPGYMRLPRTELAEAVNQWPLEGPQTWEQRKWQRIVRSRMLEPLPSTQPRRG